MLIPTELIVGDVIQYATLLQKLPKLLLQLIGTW